MNSIGGDVLAGVNKAIDSRRAGLSMDLVVGNQASQLLCWS